MTSGVYEIRNTINGNRYIGGTVDLVRRLRDHKQHLQKGIHHNRHLQAAWNKYGGQVFSFAVILICAGTKEQIFLYEDLCIKGLKPEYNMNPASASPLGIKRSLETKKRISESKKGKKGTPWSPEARVAFSLQKKGIPLNPQDAKRAAEQCQIMAAGNIGRIRSADTKKKMSRALEGNTRTLGFKYPPERNAAISVKLTGRKRPPFSQTWLDNMSKAGRGKPKPLEWRRRMSVIMTGKKRAPKGN